MNSGILSLPNQIPQKILQDLGLNNLPAVPIAYSDILSTITKLANRADQTKDALDGLTNKYTINGASHSAREFIFGKPTNFLSRGIEDIKKMLELEKNIVLENICENILKKETTTQNNNDSKLTGLSLESPKQWAMSWTTYAGIYDHAEKNVLESFKESLEDVEEANRLFWPNIAKYGTAYNLLILQKMNESQLENIQSVFDSIWSEEITQMFQEGSLYFIDMSIFNTTESAKVDGFDRFTPGTMILLQQNKKTKELTPIAIHVSDHDNNNYNYTKKDKAWLYALQAAKTSVTVFGIWLGHVYHQHIVTAAMLMTFQNNVSKDHPLRNLILPQSNYVVGFDDVLLLLWGEIAPPTSVSSAFQFLKLINTFAENRSYFDDDPVNTLERYNINKKDFSNSSDWDVYPIVGQFLTIWEYAEKYVEAFVDNTYVDDEDVSEDDELQSWIKAASNPDIGNIKGLTTINSKNMLKQVLTSLLYRITIHGISRLLSSSNPGLTFVANFPPCLQIAKVPEPDTEMTTQKLFQYMPKTGTMGKMITFYYTFAFSKPYEPFIPYNGINTDLFFSGGETDPRNRALIEYRNNLQKFIGIYSPASPPHLEQTFQWPLCIET